MNTEYPTIQNFTRILYGAARRLRQADDEADARQMQQWLSREHCFTQITALESDAAAKYAIYSGFHIR